MVHVIVSQFISFSRDGGTKVLDVPAPYHAVPKMASFRDLISLSIFRARGFVMGRESGRDYAISSSCGERESWAVFVLDRVKTGIGKETDLQSLFVNMRERLCG